MSAVTQLAVVVVIASIGAGSSFLMRESEAVPAGYQCDRAALNEDEICLEDVGDGVLWVDARSRLEWEETGVTGSILWNMDPGEDASAFERDAALKIMEAPMVVVYCGSEACGTSRQIANRIREMQLGPPVKILSGGWDALKDSNRGK